MLEKTARIYRVLPLLACACLSGCGTEGTPEKGSAQVTPVLAGLPDEANRVIKDRSLSPDDVTAALATYMPTGKLDEYVMFASGGHGGQVLAIGLPSMRLLRTIAVFTPEPWQGYGYGVKESALPPPVVSRPASAAGL